MPETAGPLTLIRKKMNIVGLKRFVAERLPAGSSLRSVILAESDELGMEEFLAKMEVWLKLLNVEFS